MSNATMHPNSRISPFVPALAICVMAGSAIQAQQRSAIAGWTAVTTDAGEYSIAPEPLRRTGGYGTMGVEIASRVASPTGSALLLQSIRADEFRGRRVRFAGWLRTEDVDGQSGLLARVDGAGVVQTSDYMVGHPVMGTTAWRHYEIVLDVPRDAVGITFGLQLTGTGQVYADDFALDAVDEGIAVTGGAGNVIFPTQNLAAGGSGNGGSGNGGSGNGGGVIQAGAPRTLNTAQLRDQERKYSRAPLRPTNLDFERVPEI